MKKKELYIFFFVIPDFIKSSQFLNSISRICGNTVLSIVKEDVIKEHLSHLYPKTGKTSLTFKKGNKDDLVSYRLVCKRENLLFSMCVPKSGPHGPDRQWRLDKLLSNWVWLEQDAPPI